MRLSLYGLFALSVRRHTDFYQLLRRLTITDTYILSLLTPKHHLLFIFISYIIFLHTHILGLLIFIHFITLHTEIAWYSQSPFLDLSSSYLLILILCLYLFLCIIPFSFLLLHVIILNWCLCRDAESIGMEPDSNLQSENSSKDPIQTCPRDIFSPSYLTLNILPTPEFSVLSYIYHHIQFLQSLYSSLGLYPPFLFSVFLSLLMPKSNAFTCPISLLFASLPDKHLLFISILQFFIILLLLYIYMSSKLSFLI